VGNHRISPGLAPRTGRAIGALTPQRELARVTPMWTRENARFPGINWGAARASKLESRRPVSAIRGKPLSESWPTVTGLRVWHSLKIRQSIDVLDLTGIAHVSPVRTLRQLVTQVRHGDVRAVLLKQPVNPVLPSSAALVAHEAYIPQVRRTIWDEFSMQFYA
jgi:hypothetical protein